MAESWRVPLIITSHFDMYKSIKKTQKLNYKKKLIGQLSPTVPWTLTLQYPLINTLIFLLELVIEENL